MFRLDKVLKGIYLLSFNERLDLCSHFMRYQEIYESPCDDFYSKPFQLIDYIKWYSSNDEDRYFTYYSDWSGFNIPVNIILDFYPEIQDKNSHDRFMKQVADYIVKDHGNNYCYLIGTCTNDTVTINHEIAHGLYFTNSNYKNNMINALTNLDEKKNRKMCDILSDLGYRSNLFYDEMQAFLSTGLTDDMKKHISTKDTNRFRSIFNKFTKDLNVG